MFPKRTIKTHKFSQVPDTNQQQKNSVALIYINNTLSKKEIKKTVHLQ